MTGEEPPPHSGELNHALSATSGPTQPSYPALRCQDTTSPWSTDYGGNIYSQTLELMPAMKHICTKYKKKIFEEKNKNEKNEKHECGVNLKWAVLDPLSTEARKSNFHKRKIVIFTITTSRRFIFRFGRLLGEDFQGRKFFKVFVFTRKILDDLQGLKLLL